MRGEQFIINKLTLEDPDCPIKESIGELTPERLVEVIEQEYWNEWNRLLSSAETSSIYCRNLGKFYIDPRKLRLHMWKLLEEMKKMRKNIKKAPEEKKDFLIKKLSDYKEKFRCCWKQWEEQRKIWILRTIRWNDKLRSRGEESRIKYNYEQFNFSFVK